MILVQNKGVAFFKKRQGPKVTIYRGKRDIFKYPGEQITGRIFIPYLHGILRILINLLAV